MLVFVLLFPGGGVFFGNASEAVSETDFSRSSWFPVFSADGCFAGVFCNIRYIKIHVHVDSLL